MTIKKCLVEIIQAMQLGTAEELRSFIVENDIDVNEVTDEDDTTCLILGVSLKRLEIVKTLIDLGANLNHQRKDGFTPLHLACSIPDSTGLEIAKCLVDAKANVNASFKLPDGSLVTPLSIAMLTNNQPMIDYIKSVDGIVFQATNSYEGEWADGLPHGKGIFTFSTGGIYTGEFVNGKFQGKGKQTYSYGDVYEGNFVHNKPTGKGKLTLANGTIQEGEFEDGVLKSSKSWIKKYLIIYR